MDNNNNNNLNNFSHIDDENAPLALTWTEKSSEEESQPKQNVSETMKFDHLGPIIINSDGSTSRISNWDTMTETEQQKTLKLIARRNQIRRDNLGGEITF
jgi:hypothetical protein